MTRTLSALSALALGLAVAAADGAAAQEGVIVDDATIVGWEATVQSGLMGGFPATMSEFVPPGETVYEWTRMVTVASYDLRGIDPRPTADLVYVGMKDQYETLCGKSYSSEAEIRQAGEDAGVFFIVACDDAPSGPTAGSGDYTAVLLIDTEDSLHMIQRAWRGELPDPNVRPISDEELADWMSFFDSVRVARSE